MNRYVLVRKPPNSPMVGATVAKSPKTVNFPPKRAVYTVGISKMRFGM